MITNFFTFALKNNEYILTSFSVGDMEFPQADGLVENIEAVTHRMAGLGFYKMETQIFANECHIAYKKPENDLDRLSIQAAIKAQSSQ